MRRIIENTKLTPIQKFVALIVYHYYPASRAQIEKALDTYPKRVIDTVINQLELKKIIYQQGGDFYFPVFSFSGPPKGKPATKKPTTQTLPQKESDVQVFIKELESFLEKKGVTVGCLGKKNKKHIINTVSYLNGLWKDREKQQNTNNKTDLYNSFIEFVFRDQTAEETLHIKRLTYGKVRAAFLAHYKRTSLMFKPFFLPNTTSKTIFYGIAKKDIPPASRSSGYWNTVNYFLLTKKDNYPLCTEVLYALEMIIVYALFRKEEDVTELIKLHLKYLKEYKKAANTESLDNLVEYVTRAKRKPHYCDDCGKVDKCSTSKKNVVNCLDKKHTK